MVVAPLAVLLLAGGEGVVLTNLVGAAGGALLLWSVPDQIEWARLGLLAVSTVIGALIGALIVGSLDVAVFRLAVGILLTLAILGSLLIGRLSLHVTAPGWALLAGGATGTLVTISGIGGPPMSIYAVASDWPHRRFAATMQPYVAFSSLIGAGAVLLVEPTALPDLPGWMWAAVGAALAAGLVGGSVLSRIVSESTGRAIVVTLGLIGAASAIASGLSILLER